MAMDVGCLHTKGKYNLETVLFVFGSQIYPYVHLVVILKTVVADVCIFITMSIFTFQQSSLYFDAGMTFVVCIYLC